VAHAWSAVLYAGDWTMIPELRSEKPPPGLGSGKFGTPCERMQSEYLTPWAYCTGTGVVEPAAVALLADREEPQAAATSAPPTTTSATEKSWPGRPRNDPRGLISISALELTAHTNL
jgi:hypothetical protein